jgi:hypothetical protein
MTPDGLHLALARQLPAGVEVWVDGTRHPVVRELLSDLATSRDGRRVAYVARTLSSGERRVVVNGDTWRSLALGAANGEPRDVRVSPDGQHLAIVATRPEGRAFVIRDAEAVGEIGSLRGFAGFHDTGHFAMSAGGDRYESMWVDGWDRSGYDSVSSGAWNPDGTVRFAGIRQGRPVLYDGRREIAVAGPIETGIARSRSGKLAYGVRAASQVQLVIDDQIVRTHDRVQGLRFGGARGERVVYVAADQDVMRVVVAGLADGTPARRIDPGSLEIRRGGESGGVCVVYAARDRHGSAASAPGAGQPVAWEIVREPIGRGVARCERRVWGPFTRVAPPRFGPDGQTVAFVAADAGGSALVIGDRRIAVADLRPDLRGVRWGRDGRLIHYDASNGTLHRIVRLAGDARPSAEIARVAGIRPITEVRAQAGESARVVARTDGDRPARFSVDEARGRIAVAFTPEPDDPAMLLVRDGVPVSASARELTGFDREGRLLWTRPSDPSWKTEVWVDQERVASLENVRQLAWAEEGSGWFASAEAPHPIRTSWGRESVVVVGFASGTRRFFVDRYASSRVDRLVVDPRGRSVAWTSAGRLFVDGARLDHLGLVERFFWSDAGELVTGSRSGRVVRGNRVLAEVGATPIGFDADGELVLIERQDTATLLRRGRALGPRFSNIPVEHVTFDPARRRIAYVALDGSGKHVMVLDDRVIRRDLIDPGDLTFSPDGAHIAWTATVADSRVVFVDGRVFAGADAIDGATLRFSGDGTRFAFVHCGEQCQVSLDGADHGPYDEIATGGVVFGPSGRAAWCARRGTVWSLLRDGEVVATVDMPVPGTGPRWDGDALELFALRGRDVVEVVAAP